MASTLTIPSFIPSGLANGGRLFTKKHPSSGSETYFVSFNGKLYELLNIDRPHSSWFIGSSVVSSGCAVIASPFNPVFLAIQELLGEESCFQPLDGIFSSAKIPEFQEEYGEEVISFCSHMKYSATDVAYTINTPKLLDWLKEKAKSLLPVLRKKTDTEDTFLIESAWDILRHYIPVSLHIPLKNALKEEYPESFPKKVMELQPPPKIEEDVVPTKKQQSKNRRKQATTPAKGVRTLDAFFGPPK